jgi:hypothetical protein
VAGFCTNRQRKLLDFGGCLVAPEHRPAAQEGKCGAEQLLDAVGERPTRPDLGELCRLLHERNQRCGVP